MTNRSPPLLMVSLSEVSVTGSQLTLMMLLLTVSEISRSLMLHFSACTHHLTSSHHMAPYHLTSSQGKVWVSHNNILYERDHIHITFIKE